MTLYVSIPGFSFLEPWDTIFKSRPNPERVRRLANPFQGSMTLYVPIPRFSFLEPWDTIFKSRPNPERVRRLATPFRVQ